MPVAIGLQHATLNWENASCNCGPARHTERRESQLIEEDDKGQEDDDEGGEGGEGEEGEEGGEGEGGGEESDIKSNNPHLTGGEPFEMIHKDTHLKFLNRKRTPLKFATTKKQ